MAKLSPHSMISGLSAVRQRGESVKRSSQAASSPAVSASWRSIPRSANRGPAGAWREGNPCSTHTPPPKTTTSTEPGPIPGPVTAVGDSILLDIQPQLSIDIPGVTVDGLVSRQFETGIGVVQSHRAAGTLGRVLVVELGTNGAVTASDVDAIMQAATGVARVVLVNVCVPRDWMATDNAVLAAGVARYPGLAVLADWNTLATPHPEWFTADQVHLNPDGATALAALVAKYA